MSGIIKFIFSLGQTLALGTMLLLLILICEELGIGWTNVAFFIGLLGIFFWQAHSWIAWFERKDYEYLHNNRGIKK